MKHVISVNDFKRLWESLFISHQKKTKKIKFIKPIKGVNNGY